MALKKGVEAWPTLPYALIGIVTGNAYTAGTTLRCPRSARIRITIKDNPIMLQTGLNPGTNRDAEPPWGGQEVPYEVGMFSLDAAMDAVRVRSAIAGAPATVNISAFSERELG